MFGKRKPNGENAPERRRDVGSDAVREPQFGDSEKSGQAGKAARAGAAGNGAAPRNAAPARPGAQPAPRPSPPIANPAVNNPIAGITAPSRGAGNGQANQTQNAGGAEKPAASDSNQAAGEPQRSESKGREARSMTGESEGKKLTVGRDIRLAGEITTCDTLVVEGQVECNLSDSKILDIASSGVFKGKASVEVAEISGLFEGDLTVSHHLHLHGTGQIKGTLRYREMQVERGGRVSGDIAELDAAEAQAPAPAVEARPQPAEPSQPTLTPERDGERASRAAASGNAG